MNTCTMCGSSALVEQQDTTSITLPTGKRVVVPTQFTMCKCCGAELTFDHQLTANAEAMKEALAKL